MRKGVKDTAREQLLALAADKKHNCARLFLA